MSEDQKKEFENIAELMMEFLCNNGHPHMSVIIDCDTAVLSEGLASHVTRKYVKD